MKQAFKTAYQQELSLLKERAKAFSEEYPGLADRLGGLLEENLDPSIAGLLEGTAFLAARVQLNIRQQFRTFSAELLEQLCPDMAAPLPAAMIVQAEVPDKPDDLKHGRRLDTGEYLEASFSEGQRRVACRFRLAEPITVWPIRLTDAAYHGTATPLSALGLDGPGFDHPGGERTAAGLVFTLASTAPKTPIGDLNADTLPIHFTGTLREAQALYAQVFAHRLRVTLRWTDALDTPSFRRLPPDAVEQVGFDPENALFGRDERLFPGASLLLEYFAFPRKFLGLRLTNLQRHLRGIPTDRVQVIFEFDRAQDHLATHFDPAGLRLFSAPAVNLFEEEAKPITVDRKRHRYLVSPNRTPAVNFEVQRVVGVRAQFEGMRDKVPVLPLYALPEGDQTARQALYYSTERERRALTQAERRVGGTRYRYEGTETWITYYEPPDEAEAALLFVRTLCSSRHLPEILPLAEGTFHLLENRQVKLACVVAPSAPRDAVAEIEGDGPHRMQAGDNYWRLISLLSLSYRGLAGLDGLGNVDALREMLRLFSDVSDQLTDAQIMALHDMRVRSTVRTVERPDGFFPARGVEVTLVFDEDKMDRETMVTLGAVLDRFLADYAAVNSFTETVVLDRKEREVTRWPARGGSGPLI